MTGRFLNADDRLLAGIDVIGMNLFIYCSNDPINYADASGHCYYDAKGNWRHDNWEYLHGYERKPEPSKDSTIIVMSKKYTNRRDSGLSGKSDEEIIKKSKDRSLPGSERQRYQEEAKVRGLRNKQKRQSNFSVEVYKDSIVEIGKSIVGVGATAGCVYVLYRVVRMIPSIAPPLWWTIPLNVACP